MALPTHGAVWLDNWILGSTIASVTSQHENYPARMLLTPHRSDSWRSLSATVPTGVVFDFGERRLPTAFALIEANFTGGAEIRLRASADATQSVDEVIWDLPLYAPDPVGQVVRWYLGTPTSGTARPRRFWSLRWRPNNVGSYFTAGDFFELAVPWLGEYVPIIPASGTRIRTRNPTPRTRSYGRAMWSDPLPPGREAEVMVVANEVDDLETLAALIDAQGTRHALLDLHAYSADPVLARGGCVYGTFPDDACERGIETYGDDDKLTFAFDEAAV